jgi:Ser/Thr protein kinase RdoA (MazF antagonist)
VVLTPLGESENTVFRADLAGEGYALRLHTAGRRSVQALDSELLWLDHLSRAGLPVPAPVRTLAGGWVAELTGGESATLLRWLAGDVPEVLSVTQAAQAGGLMARLHLEAETFRRPTGFERPVYTLGHVQESWKVLQRLLSPQQLPAPQVQAIASGLEVVAQVFAQADAVPGGVGLIHTDAHPGNMLVQADQLAFIDFDRCGTGPFLLDIAGTVLDMEAAERAAFLEAYSALRPLPAEYLPTLQALMCASGLENLAFLAARLHELPGVLESLPYLVAGFERLLG